MERCFAVMAWRSDIAQEMIRPMLGVLKRHRSLRSSFWRWSGLMTQILASGDFVYYACRWFYHNVREGFDAADTKLLEMARMFELSGAKTFR